MQLLRAHILNFNHCLKREKIGEAAFCTAIPNAYCRFIALWPGQSKWIALGHVYVFIVESVMAEKVHSFTLLNPDPHNNTRQVQNNPACGLKKHRIQSQSPYVVVGSTVGGWVGKPVEIYDFGEMKYNNMIQFSFGPVFFAR